MTGTCRHPRCHAVIAEYSAKANGKNDALSEWRGRPPVPEIDTLLEGEAFENRPSPTVVEVRRLMGPVGCHTRLEVSVPGCVEDRDRRLREWGRVDCSAGESCESRSIPASEGRYVSVLWIIDRSPRLRAHGLECACSRVWNWVPVSDSTLGADSTH